MGEVGFELVTQRAAEFAHWWHYILEQKHKKTQPPIREDSESSMLTLDKPVLEHPNERGKREKIPGTPERSEFTEATGAHSAGVSRAQRLLTGLQLPTSCFLIHLNAAAVPYGPQDPA